MKFAMIRKETTTKIRQCNGLHNICSSKEKRSLHEIWEKAFVRDKTTRHRYAKSCVAAAHREGKANGEYVLQTLMKNIMFPVFILL